MIDSRLSSPSIALHEEEAHSALFRKEHAISIDLSFQSFIEFVAFCRVDTIGWKSQLKALDVIEIQSLLVRTDFTQSSKVK